MPRKRKRRLTEEELKIVRKMFESAPQGRKPTIRQLARYFGVNQPSIVKSLGGWKGIKRGRPVPPPKFAPAVIDMDSKSPAKIELVGKDIKIPDLQQVEREG